MKILSTIILTLLIAQIGFGQTYHLKNGKIWDGHKMELRDLYIVNSLFSDTKPAQVDSVIDLNGKFVIPPFGDFHTHLFDGDYSTTYDTLFRGQGIFFAQDLTNNPEGRDQMADYFHQTNTIDVAYANGCLTSDYGHPIEGYERMAHSFGWNMSPEDQKTLRESRVYENKTYYIVDDEAELNEKMKLLLATHPDVVKVILFDSEEYVLTNSIPLSNRGLNPALLPLIVEEANRNNKRVVAHVETEFDLRIAIKAGIKYFAHLPHYAYGNDGRAEKIDPVLRDSTLALMKAEKVKVNPTLSRTFGNLKYLPKKYQPDSLVLTAIKFYHTEMLKSLKVNEIQILAGADFINLTAVDEILYYGELNVFEPSELLNILIDTSKEVFPKRKIGAIKDGFEANCLILNTDPSQAINHVKEISMRIKNGSIID